MNECVSGNAQMIATCLGVTSVPTASALALSSRCPGVFSEAGLGVPNILIPLPIAPLLTTSSVPC